MKAFCSVILGETNGKIWGFSQDRDFRRRPSRGLSEHPYSTTDLVKHFASGCWPAVYCTPHFTYCKIVSFQKYLAMKKYVEAVLMTKYAVFFFCDGCM